MEREIINETALSRFRSDHLTPETVLARIPGSESVLLFDDPPGVGKSTLGRALIPAALKADYDLVILVAPTRAILAEFSSASALGLDPETVITLEARPRSRCGAMDQEWARLERQGCAALARDRLCQACPRRAKCSWPDQMNLIDETTRLIVLTEQYLNLVPSMIPNLIKRCGAQRPLVILDEALFLTQPMTRRISRQDLDRFAEVLAATHVDHGIGAAALQKWREDIAGLLKGKADIDDLPRFFPNSLEHAVLAVQQTGQAMFGEGFRYLVPDLSLLNSKVTTGQWRRDGMLEIAVRVDLGSARVVVLGPYLDPDFVEERLQRSVLVANADQIFRHSATHVVNIRDTIGSARSMGYEPHRRRVVDTMTALTIRNALIGKRTVLIGKKKHLSLIKERAEALATAAGLPLRLHLPGMRPDNETPWDIPLINFGIVGVNSLKEFDAIYCVGAYNVDERHLSRIYHRDLPPDRRHALRLRSIGRQRKVQSADGCFSSRYHARRAASLHRTLERRVVLQAIGRARPFTSPTEVILFQQDSFEDVLGPVETYDTLGSFRENWEIPTASEIARAALGDRMRPLRQDGASYRDLAKQFRISTSTAHKALTMPSLETLLRRIGR